MKINKTYYTNAEKIRFYKERIKSLEAKLASERREKRSPERLDDLQLRINSTLLELAELVNDLAQRK